MLRTYAPDARDYGGPKPSRSRMKLLFVGDVMVGRLVNDLLTRVSPEYPWDDTRILFDQADWRACNLECVISDRGEPWGITPKVFHFRSDAKNIATLKSARIDAVSLANNHTLDFEYEAMFEMLRLLDAAGIQHAGAGVDLAHAATAATSRVNGLTIRMIAMTDNQAEWEARPAHPGILYSPIDETDERAQLIIHALRDMRASADIAIVSAHWGPNWGYRPLAAHVRFGHALIDAGADIVFGHSGHVFQGVEIYRRRPIIYCAGNFIDDYAVDEVERNDESFVFIVEVSGSRIERLRLHPSQIADCQATMARGERAEQIAEKMARLCAEMGTEARWLVADQVLEVPVTSQKR
jgi:poly-gamma-glutamate capsule biosynthesis protein CapA/YwtB (metallophosphatase superfamily)